MEMMNRSLILLVISILSLSGCKENKPTAFNLSLATTTGDLFGFEGYENDMKIVKGLYDAGFRNIDLSMYNLSPQHDYMQDNWKDKILELKQYADSLGMKFVQAGVV